MMSRGHLYWILSNPIYVGRLRHKGQIHDGLHSAIIDPETFDRVHRNIPTRACLRFLPVRASASLSPAKSERPRALSSSR